MRDALVSFLFSLFCFVLFRFEKSVLRPYLLAPACSRIIIITAFSLSLSLSLSLSHKHERARARRLAQEIPDFRSVSHKRWRDVITGAQWRIDAGVGKDDEGDGGAAGNAKRKFGEGGKGG